MLQCVAVCCSVLQCVARKTRCKQTVLFGYCSVVQWIAGCWCSLQCVAVCLAHYYCRWIVLFLESGFCRFNANKHCVAVCCSVLQYTAMCCSFKCVLRPSVFFKQILCHGLPQLTRPGDELQLKSFKAPNMWPRCIPTIYSFFHKAPHCITPHHTLTHCLSSCKCFKARQSTYCNELQHAAKQRHIRHTCIYSNNVLKSRMCAGCRMCACIVYQ